MGINPLLVSAVGNDIIGDQLLQYCEQMGMNTDGIQRVSGASSAVYSAILEPSGDLDVAIADMSIFDRIVGDCLKPW